MATTKKYQDGGTTRFEKRQAKKIAKAKTRAAVAEIEGEGTVAQKRNNRADRAAVVLGTKRAKTPRRLSTSTSTSTVDNRNSGNTSNVTNSGSTSAGGSSGSSSGAGVDQSRKRSTNTSVRQTQVNNRNRTNNTSVNTSVNQSQNNSTTNYTDKSKNTSVNKTKYTDNSSRTNTNNSRRNTQIGTGNTSSKNSNYKKGGAMKKMKTGGMVNANAKVSKQTVPGSKGVKSGVNPRAAASKVARGRSGGTSTAPKTAVPRAKYGMAMRKK